MFLKNLREDVRAVLARDPAARSFWEVALCYPGIQALGAHRLANWLWRHDWKLTARWLSQVARTFTGIEIHPAARIGRRLFIDHGMGVVIGATAEVGDDCTLYQGVTLGGTALHQGKRHPTLGNEVIVGAGAQVLGGFTVGDGARIGANAVVVSAVPADATVVGIPGKPVLREMASAAEAATADAATGAGRSPVATALRADTLAPHHPPFMPYGTPCDDVADTVECRLRALMNEIDGLRRRVAELEAQPVSAKGNLAPFRAMREEDAVPGRAVPEDAVPEDAVSEDVGPRAERRF